jgi:hypothetical protein
LCRGPAVIFWGPVGCGGKGSLLEELVDELVRRDAGGGRAIEQIGDVIVYRNCDTTVGGEGHRAEPGDLLETSHDTSYYTDDRDLSNKYEIPRSALVAADLRRH